MIFLDVEARGRRCFTEFVETRIVGDKNLWDRMPKVKYLNWSDGCKTVKMKGSSGDLSFKATNSYLSAS